MQPADVRRALAVASAAWLAACAPSPTVVAPPSLPSGFPEAVYRRDAAAGAAVFRVDPATSRVVVTVRRSGSLAHLGHDHVVASRDVEGYVENGAGKADLYVPLDRLVVDEPALRDEAGLDGAPSPADVDGTRHNMLHKVLHTERNAFATIAVRRIAADRFEVAIILNGVTRTQEVSIMVSADAAALDARGHLALAQSDFGIEPFAILGGAIAVADRIDLAFDIHARRVTR